MLNRRNRTDILGSRHLTVRWGTPKGVGAVAIYGRLEMGAKCCEESRADAPCLDDAARAGATPDAEQRRAARGALYNAVRRNDVERADECEVCGHDFSEFQCHAHHDDYSKPLDVRWLCARCHYAEHGLLSWAGLDKLDSSATTLGPYREMRAALLEQFERDYITALVGSSETMLDAARIAGVHRATLYRIMLRHGPPPQ